MPGHRVFCRKCRYELAGLVCNVCPECGRPFDPARRRSFSRHPQLRKWRLRIIAGVLAPILGYAASYFALVQTQPPNWRGPVSFSRTTDQEVMILPLSASYRTGGDWARVVYSPIHAVDRKLRPDSWSTRLLLFPAQPESYLWAGM
jgi:hypothetical protein